jgi:hypothetical protein
MTFLALVLILALGIPVVTFLFAPSRGAEQGPRIAGRVGDEATERADLSEAIRRLDLLEGDVEILQHALEELGEENDFLRRQIEAGQPPNRLPADRR